jgi:hypothetical protein
MYRHHPPITLPPPHPTTPFHPTQAGLPDLRDVLFVGNPIYEGLSKEEAKIEVLRRLPHVKKVDGEIVTPSDQEKARSGGSGGSGAGGVAAAD